MSQHARGRWTRVGGARPCTFCGKPIRFAKREGQRVPVEDRGEVLRNGQTWREPHRCIGARIRCKRCGASGLHWRRYEGKWRLFEQGERLHWCNRPTAATLKNRPRADYASQEPSGHRGRPRETRRPADTELHRYISKTLTAFPRPDESCGTGSEAQQEGGPTT